MSVDTAPGHLDHFLSKDKRFYVFGEGEDQETLMRVSTALEHLDKEGLRRWAAGLATDAALDELPKLIKAIRTKDCGNTFKRHRHDDWRIKCVDCACGECRTCVRKWLANRHYYETSRRAEEGTRVHDVAEHWVLNGGVTPPHAEDIAIYVKQWLQWADDYGLTPDSWEMTEATVINRQYGYAGTLDGIITVHADATPLAADLVARVLALPLSQVAGKSARVIADAKSREKEEAQLYPEYSLQQTAYRNGEVVRLRDGREFPLPETDGAIIVQVRPDGYLCRPVATDDATFAAFLSVLSFAKWHLEFATASVSSRSFKVPKEPAKPKKTVSEPPACTTCHGTGVFAEEWLEAPPEDRPDGVGGPCGACGGTGHATGEAATKPTPVKRAPRSAARKALRGVAAADVPEPNSAPPSDTKLATVAANQSATMRAVRDWKAEEPHPNSPYGDAIPF